MKSCRWQTAKEPTYRYHRKTGGERKTRITYFGTTNVVAELKSLQQEGFTPNYFQKLKAKAHSWRDRGLVRAYGRTILEIRRVPRPCQDDWLRLLTSPLQSKVISEPNRQIGGIKKMLNLPDAKGSSSSRK